MRKAIVIIFIAILALLAPVLLSKYYTDQDPSFEDYANFSVNDLVQVRWIIYKACTIHTDAYQIASYVRNESFFTFGSNWNVFINQNSDTSYYTTAFYNKGEGKRFYRVFDTPSVSRVLYLVETNNTRPQGSGNEPQLQPLDKGQKSLQYASKISKDLTMNQFQVISDSVEEIYQRTTDPKEYSLALQQILRDRLGEQWVIYTARQLINFGIAYTSPYNQWVEFVQQIRAEAGLFIFVWRNYING